MINKRENKGNKNLNDPNAFIEYFNSMDDVYDDINDYNPKRKRKVLIIFDNMTADVMTNKKFQIIIKKLFIRCRKINVSLCFISQSYFSVPKHVGLNSTYYVIFKVNNKKKPHKILLSIIVQILIIKIF